MRLFAFSAELFVPSKEKKISLWREKLSPTSASASAPSAVLFSGRRERVDYFFSVENSLPNLIRFLLDFYEERENWLWFVLVDM